MPLLIGIGLLLLLILGLRWYAGATPRMVMKALAWAVMNLLAAVVSREASHHGNPRCLEKLIQEILENKPASLVVIQRRQVLEHIEAGGDLFSPLSGVFLSLPLLLSKPLCLLPPRLLGTPFSLDRLHLLKASKDFPSLLNRRPGLDRNNRTIRQNTSSRQKDSRDAPT